MRARRRVFTGQGTWQALGGGTSVTVPSAVTAGAPALGSTAYVWPIGAPQRTVSTSGNDTTGDGSVGSPWATLDKAIQSAPAGAYITLRGGTYFQGDLTASPTGKALTIQPYGNEVVWLDGSRVISTGSITSLGGNLYRWAYTARPISSATTGGTNPNRRLSDQLFIDDVRWSQVADGATPTVDKTFSVDRTAGTMTAYIAGGVTGKSIKVSDKTKLLNVRGGLELLGLGVRYYSPAEVSGGNSRQVLYVTSAASGFRAEGCVFRGTSAISIEIIGGNDQTVRRCTFEESGTTGLNVSRANRLLVESNLFRSGNRRGWQAQPETGGFKIMSTDQAVVRFNYTYDIPNGLGNWFDVSNIRTAYYLNVVDGRDFGGGQMESALSWEENDGGFVDGVQYRSYVVGNVFRGGRNFAAIIPSSGYTDWWNNRFYEAGIGQFALQKDRVDNPNTSDANNIDRLTTVAPWRSTNHRLYNNDFGYSAAGAGIQIMAYDDRFDGSTETMRGWDFFERIEGNWFRPAPPGSMAQLGRIDSTRASFNTLGALQASLSDPAFGGSSSSPPTSKLGTNYQSATPPDPTVIAKPLPAEIAALLGVAAGTQLIGPNAARLPSPIA